jgi:hypothetical protein
MGRYLIILDTPGIKQFVFGTDTLAEVRGASALLDRLNRFETEACLSRAPGVHITKVFAAGGGGQFIAQAPDRAHVQRALDQLALDYLKKTGGEMRPLAGVAEWAGEDETGYRDAVNSAHKELRLRRSLASHRPTVPTLPFVLECQSTSHLPAVPGVYRWGDERLLLSRASQRKREESRQARHGILWSGWMESLDPDRRFLDRADDLRYPDAEGIGEHCSGRRRGYVGLIYADGNAMGRLVQELDSREVCKAFSELVDGSVRDACYEALREVCAPEIAAARAALARGENPGRLPADILLLGGDDLLVLLPADRALNFALRVAAAFERLTHERQAQLPEAARRFFADRGLADRGLTISCGVALGPARYPFYLLLDFAEELLRSAKRGGSADETKMAFWAPAYLDFHLLAGSASQELSAIREEDYLTQSDCARTLRPYRRDRLDLLRQAAERLQQARLPRSKLQDLFEAALEPRRLQAQSRARELFGRLREARDHHERRGLWDALSLLGPLDPYPWTRCNGRIATALADLVEAVDLFGRPEEA